MTNPFDSHHGAVGLRPGQAGRARAPTRSRATSTSSCRCSRPRARAACSRCALSARATSSSPSSATSSRSSPRCSPTALERRTPRRRRARRAPDGAAAERRQARAGAPLAGRDRRGRAAESLAPVLAKHPVVNEVPRRPAARLRPTRCCCERVFLQPRRQRRQAHAGGTRHVTHLRAREWAARRSRSPSRTTARARPKGRGGGGFRILRTRRAAARKRRALGSPSPRRSWKRTAKCARESAAASAARGRVHLPLVKPSPRRDAGHGGHEGFLFKTLQPLNGPRSIHGLMRVQQKPS